MYKSLISNLILFLLISVLFIPAFFACDQTPQSQVKVFPVMSPPGDCMDSFITGKLVNDNGYLRLENFGEHDPGVLIIWPPGYSFTENNGDIQILDRNGKLAVTAGDWVLISGGFASKREHVENMLEYSLPDDCEGPYFIAGSEVRKYDLVIFNDSNLEDAVRKAIGKPGGNIYADDLSDLAKLSAPDRGIVDLTGLDECKNLKWLDLSGNQISDPSDLPRTNGKLEYLDLSDNKITETIMFMAITSLRTLDLSGNEIININWLRSLDSLERLDLSNNKISDISILIKLESLKTLMVTEGNPLNDNSLHVIVPELEACGIKVY